MAFFLSSLANLFSGRKKRHNTESIPTALKRPLTREEFLSVYQSMPEAARAQLFSSLGYQQKARLLELLTPEPRSSGAQPSADEPVWQAEDFLPEKDEQKIARLRQLRELRELKTLFAELEQREPLAVAEVLAAESAIIAAMALLQFSQKFASRVLRAMPELRRGEIVRSMAMERHVSGEVLLALGKKISEKVAVIPTTAAEGRIDGVKHVNEILKLLGADEADRITREVAEHDQQLARTLEKHRYTFEDLIHLNARDFRHLFSSMPDEQLWARALKAVDQSQRKSLLGKLPVKRAGLIAQAMSEIKTTRLDSIDKARSKILANALRLAAANQISFGGHHAAPKGLLGNGLH